jgi:hypothetical protein
MKTLRRCIYVLRFVQYQNRYGIDTVRARELTKMHASGKVVPDLQPQARAAADDAAAKRDAHGGAEQ